MSKDIRSFFAKKPKKDGNSVDSARITKPTNKKPLVLSSDDEEVPGIPEPQQKIQKKRRIISDSDEENTMKKRKKVKSDSKASSSKSKSRTPVKAADIFGSEPVKRSETKSKSSKSATNIADAKLHLEDDFNETLMDLNEEIIINQSPKVESKQRNDKNNKRSDKNNEGDISNTKTETKTTPVKENGRRTPSKKTPEKSLVENKTLAKTPREIKPPVSTPKEKKTPIRTPKAKKTPIQKHSKTNDEDQDNDIDPDQERYEKRRQSAALYQKFLKRSGPRNPGSKEIPEGKPGCLSGLVFVITGILESLERDEAAQIITDLGGRVPGQISGKVTHLLLGEDAGPAKLAKAESLNIKILSEDDLLDLIREKSGLPTKKTEKHASKEADEQPDNKKIKIDKTSPKDKYVKNERSTRSTPKKNDPKEIKKEIETPKKDIAKTLDYNIKKEKSDKTPKKNGLKSSSKSFKDDISNTSKATSKKISMKNENENVSIPRTTDEHYDNIHSIENLAWVDKHKPTNCKQIIGQQGPGSNCAKLMNWLSKWHVNHNGKTKLVKPSPWAKSDDGAYFKAALLSGPPGVGKTTTATLVCKELGFDAVEFNASDTRSKKLLKDQISELLSNKSLHGYFSGGNEATSKKHVLIMDEVDGMAGNEDRGGLQELINLIKNASVPVICMCNDRNHQKMRTLVNYCYDLRFNKPRLDQIKGAMMSVCFKEGVKIAPDALADIITGANQDVRQILNHLSMWSADNKNINAVTASKEANSAKKDIKIGPWEVVRKVFSKEEHKTMTMQDKSDLFFHDYSLSPLFVQQNYLIVSPSCPKNEILKRVALTADSLSLGDLVDKHIRSSMAWSLLPTQAMFSSVLPGEYMCGHVAGQINFPGWLGKNSKRNKLLRMSSEVYSHIKSKTTCSKYSIKLDYAKPLLNAITRPLNKEGANGVAETLEVLKEYQLLREDIESLQELNSWPGSKDPMANVDGRVKAALTRAFNKELAPYSYSTTTVSKKKSTEADELALLENDEDVVQDSEDEQETDNIENDALIKTKKKTAAKAPASTSKGATTSKGAARGKGRGKGK